MTVVGTETPVKEESKCVVIDEICQCGHSIKEHGTIISDANGVTIGVTQNEGSCLFKNCWCERYVMDHPMLEQEG